MHKGRNSKANVVERDVRAERPKAIIGRGPTMKTIIILLSNAATGLAIALVPGAVQAQATATWVASSYTNDGSAPWLAPGQAAAGDVSAGRDAGAGASAPMPEYQFEGRQGQVVTVRVTSPDVHTSVYIRRSSGVTPIGYSAFSTKDIDRSSEVTATIPKDGTYLIVIGAHQTNKKGGPVWSWQNRAQAGRYVITLAEGTSALPAPDASAASNLSVAEAQSDSGGTPSAELAAASLTPRPGVFITQDEVAMVISFEGPIMTVNGPYGRGKYHRQPDGRFLLSDGSEEMRFLDGDTIEYVSTGRPESLPGLAIRAAPEMQMPQLAYGQYQREGFEDHPGVTVFEYRGDVLRLGAHSSPVEDHVLRSDGKYHSPHGSGTYRIIDMYTVERGPPAGYGGPAYPTYRLVRVGDASPTFFGEESGKWNEWFGEYKAADDARWAAAEEERLALEQEQAEREEWESQQASANAGGIMGAMLRGWTEATAKNEAMERSMSESANAAIARGTAQYARDRDSSDRVSSVNRQPGLTIENRAEPTSSAREPAEPQTRQTYAWCMALRPNQNVTYSSVQQITIPNRGWSDSSMAQRFGAVAGGGVSVCSNTDSHAAAQAQLDSSKAQHRGIRQTTTSAILKP
jgi:hypothetical protein